MLTKDLFGLKDKVVLITGGIGLYGRCIFEGLLEMDGTVITASRSLSHAQKLVNEFKSKGLDAHAKHVDQADHESIIKLKSEIQEAQSSLRPTIFNDL